MKLTFPINRKELRKKALMTVCRSVFTWLALLPTLGALSVRETTPYMFIPIAMVTLAGLWFYWSKELKKRRPVWIEEKVRASNAQQDKLIKSQVLHFQRQGSHWEGQQLQSALQSKQAIENRLLIKTPELVIWSRVENLVDTIIYSLIDKLELHRKSQSDEAKADIGEAVYQMQKAEEGIDDMIAPYLNNDEPYNPSGDQLSIALRELKEEREIAERVKVRLQDGFSESTYTN